jgi:hypothetical protein
VGDHSHAASERQLDHAGSAARTGAIPFSTSPDQLLVLQRTLGNQGFQRALKDRPELLAAALGGASNQALQRMRLQYAHAPQNAEQRYDAPSRAGGTSPQVSGAQNVAQRSVAVQRIDDPDGSILETLRGAHAALYGEYKNLATTFPTPSKMTRRLRNIVAIASSKEDAYARYAEIVVTEFFQLNESGTRSKRQEAIDACTNLESSTKARTEKLARALKEVREESTSAGEERPRKKLRLEEAGQSRKTYSDEERAQLKAKLATTQFQQRLFQASMHGYARHSKKGRAAVAKASRLNALAETQPLSTADMAVAHANYPHTRIGDSLILEPHVAGSQQVTMTRGGGQEIHQLGPYLASGSRKSVEQIIKEVLRETGLKSRDLAEAINLRRLEDVVEWLKQRGASADDKQIGKIRAMRQLLGVEKDRGPEVSLATALEHRSAALGYRHIEEYPRHTPLGPGSATTDIRTARKRKLEESQATDFPPDFTYIPGYIQKRAVNSITHFVTNFMDDVSGPFDREAETLVAVMLTEDPKKAPTEDLYDAVASVLRTPEQSGYMDDEPTIAASTATETPPVPNVVGPGSATPVEEPIEAPIAGSAMAWELGPDSPAPPPQLPFSTEPLLADPMATSTEQAAADLEPATAAFMSSEDLQSLGLHPSELEWLQQTMAEFSEFSERRGENGGAERDDEFTGGEPLGSFAATHEHQTWQAETDQRFTTFKDLLRSVAPEEDEPVAFEERAPERHSPASLYANVEGPSGRSVESATRSVSFFDSPRPEPLRFDAARFQRTWNPGGGDCLFHALAGRTLTLGELLAMRAEVAQERGRMVDDQARSAMNALNIANAMYQTFPDSPNAVAEMVSGRHHVPNAVYAAMQSVPGLYAGEDELIQWCRLRNVRVAVVDANGMLAVFSANGREPWAVTHENLYQRAMQAIAETNFALYKSPGHWERITAMDVTPPQPQPTFWPPGPNHEDFFEYEFEEGEDWFG